MYFSLFSMRHLERPRKQELFCISKTILLLKIDHKLTPWIDFLTGKRKKMPLQHFFLLFLVLKLQALTFGVD